MKIKFNIFPLLAAILIYTFLFVPTMIYHWIVTIIALTAAVPIFKYLGMKTFNLYTPILNKVERVSEEYDIKTKPVMMHVVDAVYETAMQRGLRRAGRTTSKMASGFALGYKAAKKTEL